MKKKQLVLTTCDSIINSMHLLEDHLYGPGFDKADKDMAMDLAPLRSKLGHAREIYKQDKGEIVRVPAIKEPEYEFGAKQFPYDD